MKKLLILTLTALCLAPLTLVGQTYESAPVTLSEEKVSKDGKTYLAHTVQDHQTLYSISRAYRVNYQDILDANPGEDLSAGNIKVGQIILIPFVQTDTEYVAKWFETLDMIAARYNVSKEVLMAYNGMKTDKIERRQKIRIPAHPELVAVAGAAAVASDTETTPEGTEESLAEATDGTETDPSQARTEGSGFSLRDLFRRKPVDETIHVGVVLPFQAQGSLNHSAFDLYSGMLLAVRDLEKTGTKVSLNVLDNKNAATPVTAEALHGLDLVIGPIAPDDLKTVLDLCPRSTVVVSPLDPKASALATEYPNFIQAPSPAEAQYLDLIDWIREDLENGDRVIVIAEKGAEPIPLMTALVESGLDYQTITLSPGEAQNSADRLQELTSRNGTTHAVIASERESFVNDVVRNLNLLTYKDLDVVLYGPSKIRTFDMVEVENLHRINAHLSCSYFIDYDNARIKDFLLSYRALFGAEPTQFAYQGYDIAWYFIRNFATAERSWERRARLEERKFKGLQSDFLITDEEGGGHVNFAVRRVIYGVDYTISLLNL